MNRGSRIDLLRVVIVAGLLVLVGLALAARRGRSFPGAPEDRSSAVVFGLLVLLIGCWVLTYLLATRALGTARRARPLAALISTAAFGVTAALIMGDQSRPQPSGCDLRPEECSTYERSPTPLEVPSGNSGSTPSGDRFTLPLAPLLIVLGLVTVALVTIIVLGRRRPAEPLEDPSGLTPAALRDAVEAAGYALRLGDGPRDAVIACYVAMERAIAGAGAAPRPSDTPAEVLTRAAASGLISGSAAEALTELFRTARFSRHPITGEHVQRAEEALTAVREDLGAVGEEP